MFMSTLTVVTVNGVGLGLPISDNAATKATRNGRVSVNMDIQDLHSMVEGSMVMSTTGEMNLESA